MKITINIDCSPKEAREFLGLPDIEPIQKAFMEQMQEKITAGLSTDEMTKMFELWMTPGLTSGLKAASSNISDNMVGIQTAFWQNMFGQAARPAKPEDKK